MNEKKASQRGFLNALWLLVSGFPAMIIAVGVTLTLLSGLCASSFLQLNSDQDRLVSPDVPFQKRYLEYLKNFGDQEYLYVVIRAGGSEEGKRTAERFAENLACRLRKHPELIQAIYYSITPEEFGNSALLFASLQEAEALTQSVGLLAPFIKSWLDDGSLAGFINFLADLLQGREGSPLVGDPAFLRQGLDWLGEFSKGIDETLGGGSPHSSIFDLTAGGRHYFFTGNGQLLVMRLLPDKDYSTMSVVGKPLEVVRDSLRAVRAEFPDVKAGLTGRPVLQADEMETTDKDMTRAAVIAIFLVGLLFTIVLHGWLRPLLILITLVMAIGWTFGFATMAVGELNLLSIVFALVLVGIGVDFGVHIVTRYVEGRMSGLKTEEAVQTSVLKTGPGIMLSALTSVCAFYVVLGSDFQGLAELGLIGGTGVLLCMLGMMTVLPTMLLLAEKKDLSPRSAPRLITMPILERLFKRPGALLIVLVSVTAAATPGLRDVSFDYNLLELQAGGLESVEYEKLLIDSSDESTWYAILAADSMEQVKRLTTRLEAIPSVGRVENIMDFLPEDQREKLALYAKAAEALKGFHAHEPKHANPDPDLLAKALERLSGALGALDEKLFAAGASAELILLDRSIGYLESARERIEANPAQVWLLEGLQAELQRSLVKTLRQLKLWVTTTSVAPKDLPASIRDMYIGKDGRYQIKVTPKEDVWDFDKLERFVSDLREVDPEVSGVPVGVFESARLMHRAFLSAAGLTIVLVSFILWLYSRSVSYVFLTLLPLGVGMLWLLEVMGWLGVSFNLANFFAIPILIAIGVDGSIHLVKRWGELNNQDGLFATSTPTAVALSFTTTMIGFGGLFLAHHRGLESLGTVMVLGSFTSMLACLLVLPAVLKIAGGPKTKKGGYCQLFRLIALVVCVALTWTSQCLAAENLDFAVIQPGQPGTPQEAQPVMDALAAYIQKRLGITAIKGRYCNELKQALDLMRHAPPRWSIVSLGFYAEHAEDFQMKPLTSTRPGGFEKDIWRLVVHKGAQNNWQALGGSVRGTMLFEQEAAACFLFGTKSSRLPFTLRGTFRPLHSLRAAASGKATGVVLDRMQYEALKSLPLTEELKVIHVSRELPTSAVIWFGPPNQWMERLATVLLGMRGDPDAAGLLQLLQTEGFGPPDGELPGFRLDAESAICSP